jgi:hypothetical protein
MVKLKTHLFPLLGRYITLVIVGMAIDGLWGLCNIEHYEHWGHFYTLWSPLMYAMFSSLYALSLTWIGLKSDRRVDQQLIRYQRYDDYTYFGLLLIPILEVAAPSVGSVFMWLAVIYLSLIFVKGGIFAAYVFQIFQHEFSEMTVEISSNLSESPNNSASLQYMRRVPLFLQIFLLFASLSIYASVSAYHVHRTSLTGDEPHYLLITHSLLYDHDTNLYNNYQNRDYTRFFWHDLQPAWGDQVSDTEIYSYRHKGGFPYFLLPGYALRGQFGAVLQMNIITALLMVQIFLLSYELFHSFSAAFYTWLFSSFSVPIMVFMGQLYPEIPAALFTTFAARQVLKLSDHQVKKGHAFWYHCLFFACSLAALIALKTRYLPIVGMLGLVWVICLFKEYLRGKYRFWGAIGIVVASGLGGALLILVDKLVFEGDFWGRLSDKSFMAWMLRGHNSFYAALGLLSDQEYGLLTYSPIYIVAILGIGLLSYKHFGRMWPLLGIFGVNYIVIAMWPLWHAAPTPPSRYILPALPILAAFMGRFFLSSPRIIQILVVGLSGIWSAIMSWFLTLIPSFRYNWADGTSLFLETISSRIGINMTKLFPSWIRLSPLTPYVTLLGAILIVGTIVLCRRRAFLPFSITRNNFQQFPSIPLILIMFMGIAYGTVVIGMTLPTQVLEMEDRLDVRWNGGTREPQSLDPWDNQIYLREKVYYGWRLSPGNSVRMRPRLSIGTHSLIIQARVILGDDATSPRLKVLLNNEEITETVISSTGWKEYSVTMVSKEKRPLIEILYASNLPDDSTVVIDKVRFN